MLIKDLASKRSAVFKYRYDDVSSQRFDDTSIDTAGPVSILWHDCSSVGPRLI